MKGCRKFSFNSVRKTKHERRGTISLFRPSSFVFLPALLFLSFAFCFLSSVCYAQASVTSTELIERAKEFNGKEIIYQGEAIGEVMARGEHSWVNLNDGKNAIGIWLPNRFLNLIYLVGNYNTQGDWLEVKGIFNRSCKEHGGDLDIHGLNVVKVRAGKEIKHQVSIQKQRLVTILLGALLCLLILELWKQKLKKK